MPYSYLIIMNIQPVSEKCIFWSLFIDCLPMMTSRVTYFTPQAHTCPPAFATPNNEKMFRKDLKNKLKWKWTDREGMN